MRIPGPFENYPPNWGIYEQYAPQLLPLAMGLSGSIGDINRFGARYRLAKSFRGLNLEGYTSETAAGYSALTRVMLAWSAFERFQEVIGVQQDRLGALLAKYDLQKIQAEIRARDTDDRFYRFIYDRVKGQNRDQLENYLRANPCNLTYLASSIRHIFSHGCLTPNASQVHPTIVVEICNRLCETLFLVMDREFSSCVIAFAQIVENR